MLLVFGHTSEAVFALRWGGKPCYAGIAVSPTLTSLCIPLAHAKIIFNQLHSVADGLALASETLGTNAFWELNILLMGKRILYSSFSQATVIGILILLPTASLHATPVFEENGILKIWDCYRASIRNPIPNKIDCSIKSFFNICLWRRWGKKNSPQHLQNPEVWPFHLST